jgi:hypothetical protein
VVILPIGDQAAPYPYFPIVSKKPVADPINSSPTINKSLLTSFFFVISGASNTCTEKVPCNTKNDKNKPCHTPTAPHLATTHPLCALYKPGVSHALQSANHPHTAKHPRAVSEYVELYNRGRPHQGLNNELVVPEVREIRGEGEVKVKSRLGGLLNYYTR